MSHPNLALLRELEAHGQEHDARTPDHGDRLLNITPDTGAFLAVLLRACQARRILEIGTSNGYSTLWLAEAARATGGTVTTVERQPGKAALARATFARASAIAPITIEVADAGEVLARAATGGWDFIFLDADRAHYAAWWPDLRRALAPGGLLVVDNAVSHAAEVAPLVALVTADTDLTSVLVADRQGRVRRLQGRQIASRLFPCNGLSQPTPEPKSPDTPRRRHVRRALRARLPRATARKDARALGFARFHHDVCNGSPVRHVFRIAPRRARQIVDVP